MNKLVSSIRQTLSAPLTLRRILFFGLCALPVVLYLFLVVRYSVNVPFNDEWEIVPVFKAFREGTLSLVKLWQPRNEHRSLLFYLSYLTIARISGFNAQAPLYAGTLFKILTLLMILDLFRLTLAEHKKIIPMLTLFAAVFVFSAQEGEIVIWGFASLLFNMGAFFTILVFWALVRFPGTWKGPLIAAAAALGGSLISVNGVFLWGLGLAGLLVTAFTSRPARVWTQVALWVSVMVAVLYLYFRDYHAVNSGSSLEWIIQNQPISTMYFLTYMASLTAYYNQPNSTLAAIYGAAGLLLFAGAVIYLLVTRQRALKVGDAYPWVLLAVYVLAVAAVTTLGRAHFGVWQAGSSRYVSMSYPFWLSTFVLVSVFVDQSISRKLADQSISRKALTWGVAPALIMLPIYVAYVGAFTKLVPFWHDRMATGLSYLYHYRSGPSPWFTYLYYGEPASIIPYAQYLDDNNLGPFAPGYRPAADTLTETVLAATPNDYTLSVTDPSIWSYTDMAPLAGAKGQLAITGAGPKMQSKIALNLCLKDYDFLEFQASVPYSAIGLTARVYFLVNSQETADTSRPISIPLIMDGRPRVYAFNIRLLKFPAGTRLNGMLLTFVSDNPASDESAKSLAVHDFRLIRSSLASGKKCSGASQKP